MVLLEWALAYRTCCGPLSESPPLIRVNSVCQRTCVHRGESSLRYICRECSFPGGAYIPRDQDVRGGVLVLDGSEGEGFGIHDRTAVLLACHGFTALAYDWCGSDERPVDGLPSKVVDIPIEGPVKALRWLQRHESVRNKPVAIHGISRGAELAMI
jgi:hypothetical protein